MPDKVIEHKENDPWRQRHISTGGKAFGFVSYSSQRPWIPADYPYLFLRESGNTINMNINGSPTPIPFEIEVPSARQYHLWSLSLIILASNVAPLRFGGISGGLANGLLIQAIDDDGSTVLRDFLDGETIKTNTDFSIFAGENVETDTDGVGTDAVRVLWNLKDSGGPLRLIEGQRLRVTVQDNLLALTKFVALARMNEIEEETQ